MGGFEPYRWSAHGVRLLNSCRLHIREKKMPNLCASSVARVKASWFLGFGSCVKDDLSTGLGIRHPTSFPEPARSTEPEVVSECHWVWSKNELPSSKDQLYKQNRMYKPNVSTMSVSVSQCFTVPACASRHA